VGNNLDVHTEAIIFMFFRKDGIEKIIKKLEPLDSDKFLEVEGLSGRIALDKLRYKNGTPVSCLNYAESQLLTRLLSNDGVKVRLPTLKEDYTAFKNLDDNFRETVLSQPFEWKAEYLDGSFLMVNPEVRKVNLPREYEFQGPLRILSRSSSISTSNDIHILGFEKDRHDRSALVRGYTFDRDKKNYAVAMTRPLSRECIGLRLFMGE
jgi:hypothetical protein